MDSLKFSIVICTLNRPVDLNECLSSLAHQTYAPYEVIIVDASNNKKSYNVVESWKKNKLKEIKYIHTVPGLTKQRNVGVINSSGEVIAFLDDDVILDKEYFQAMANCFENYDVIVGATGNIKNVGNASIIMGFFQKVFMLTGTASTGVMKRSGFPDFVNPLIAKNMARTEVLSGCNMLYRKEVFDSFRFNENFVGYSLGEDVELSYRVSKRNPLVYVKDAELVHVMSIEQRINYKKYIKMDIINNYQIFKNEVKKSKIDWIYFWWSKIGILLYCIGLCIKEKESGALIGLIGGIKSIIKSNE